MYIILKLGAGGGGRQGVTALFINILVDIDAGL